MAGEILLFELLLYSWKGHFLYNEKNQTHIVEKNQQYDIICRCAKKDKNKYEKNREVKVC